MDFSHALDPGHLLKSLRAAKENVELSKAKSATASSPRFEKEALHISTPPP